MPATINRSSSVERRIERYVGRRVWPIGMSAAFVVCGLLYFFRWSPVVRHRPSLWIMPSDLWVTYASASAAAHGHLGSIYGSGFLAFPGILLVLAPIGALSGRFSTVYVQVTQHGHPFTGLHYYVTHGTPTVLYDGVVNSGNLYAVHQGVFPLLATFVLVVSCTALFAFDAMAEYLGVVRWRRAVLSVAEAALLWPVVVVAGHPEDVLAVALATWALLWAFEGRWTGAGWLFGAALAVQPLVIVVFPLLLVLGGRDRALGLVVRGVVPAAAVAVGPFVADPHDMLHAVVEQPTFPNILGNHKTLWTPLAPHLSGSGTTDTVGGGPLRLVALALAAGIGWWSQRWRQRHEMVVWGAALALALRVYTESVMTAYYTWPALALGILVAARADVRRFVTALVAALVTLVVGQWSIDSYVWWAVQVVGVTVILVAAAAPLPPRAPAEPARSTARRRGAPTKRKQTARR
ncbi:MAG: hypothetical protein ABSF84_08710 [Acidimicrobiales bacterium]|jgi:hypothetical protein